MTSLVNPQDLEATRRNCDTLVEFLIDSAGAGKYNMPISRVRGLFDNITWKNISTSSGHIKIQHKITGVVVVYKNHDNDPVDAGAIVTIREVVQKHINLFYEKFLGISTRQKRQVVLDFSQIAKSLNQRKGPL